MLQRKGIRVATRFKDFISTLRPHTNRFVINRQCTNIYCITAFLYFAIVIPCSFVPYLSTRLFTYEKAQHVHM
jgi:hypothetical protein